MLDIIILVFLAIHIGKLAAKKGLKPGKWRLYTVLSFLAGEIIGLMIGLLFFEPDNIVSLILMALAGAFGGYFIIESALKKKPDTIDDDIDKIGVDDLSP